MRSVYYISDGTGITAKTFGRSLMTQFENTEIEETTIPYVDNLDKANKVVAQINTTFERTQLKPLLFTTFVNREIHKVFQQTNAFLLDFFHSFIGPLERELQTKSSHHIGKMHGIQDYQNYLARINTVNYALSSDDGNNTRYYKDAQFILVGASRCGKTPTALYLALQFGVNVANYPIIPEDMVRLELPKILAPVKDKLFGLTIDPKRLHAIRSERRPNSEYAALEQCRYEIEKIENLFKTYHIPYLDTSTRSIEEIATIITNSKP